MPATEASAVFPRRRLKFSQCGFKPSPKGTTCLHEFDQLGRDQAISSFGRVLPIGSTLYQGL